MAWRGVARTAGVNLTDLVRRSAEAARAQLADRGPVRIDVKQDLEIVIPEIGVGGYTDPRDGNVVIAIADDVQREALETWIPATVVHELHHSSRVRTGPGYGVTLGEALVSEGLADHFVSEMFPSTPSLPWDNAFRLSGKRRSGNRPGETLTSPEVMTIRLGSSGRGTCRDGLAIRSATRLLPPTLTAAVRRKR